MAKGNEQAARLAATGYTVAEKGNDGSWTAQLTFDGPGNDEWFYRIVVTGYASGDGSMEVHQRRGTGKWSRIKSTPHHSQKNIVTMAIRFKNGVRSGGAHPA